MNTPDPRVARLSAEGHSGFGFAAHCRMVVGFMSSANFLCCFSCSGHAMNVASKEMREGDFHTNFH